MGNECGTSPTAEDEATLLGEEPEQLEANEAAVSLQEHLSPRNLPSRLMFQIPCSFIPYFKTLLPSFPENNEIPSREGVQKSADP